MTTRLVSEQPSHVLSQFRAQTKETALVTATDLFGRVENQTGERAQAIDGRMRYQMYHQMFLLVSHLQSAKDSYALLLSENKTLKNDLLERTSSLESKWLGAAELLSAKVDAFYLCLNRFHQQLSLENQEAVTISDLNTSCLTADGMSYDYNESFRIFRGNYLKVGAAAETARFYREYLVFAGSNIDTISKVHLTCRETLKSIARAEIQKIQNEMPLNESTNTLSTITQQNPLFHPGFEPDDPVAADEIGAFQSFIQKNQEELQSEEKRNILLRAENENLEKKKNENFDKRLFTQWHPYIALYLSYMNRLESITNLRELYTKSYSKDLRDLPSNMRASSSVAGQYIKGIELTDRYKSHLTEIKLLAVALQKEITP